MGGLGFRLPLGCGLLAAYIGCSLKTFAAKWSGDGSSPNSACNKAVFFIQHDVSKRSIAC